LWGQTRTALQQAALRAGISWSLNWRPRAGERTGPEPLVDELFRWRCRPWPAPPPTQLAQRSSAAGHSSKPPCPAARPAGLRLPRVSLGTYGGASSVPVRHRWAWSLGLAQSTAIGSFSLPGLSSPPGPSTCHGPKQALHGCPGPPGRRLPATQHQAPFGGPGAGGTAAEEAIHHELPRGAKGPHGHLGAEAPAVSPSLTATTRQRDAGPIRPIPWVPFAFPLQR